MASSPRIYSTRFLQSWGSAGQQSYTVPQGQIAVVRSIVADSATANAVKLAVSISGVAVLLAVTLPGGSYHGQVWDMRQVVRQGEVLMVNADTGWWGAVSGYLFNAA